MLHWDPETIIDDIRNTLLIVWIIVLVIAVVIKLAVKYKKKGSDRAQTARMKNQESLSLLHNQS
jgi:heme/copper-type cytochrome/quinol oxidase subunit 2